MYEYIDQLLYPSRALFSRMFLYQCWTVLHQSQNFMIQANHEPTATSLNCFAVVFSHIVVYPSLVPMHPLSILGLLSVESLCDHPVPKETGEETDLQRQPVFRLANIQAISRVCSTCCTGGSVCDEGLRSCWSDLDSQDTSPCPPVSGQTRHIR
jgi:hypothetical protein